MTLPNLFDTFLISYLQFRKIENTEAKKKSFSIVLTLVSSYILRFRGGYRISLNRGFSDMSGLNPRTSRGVWGHAPPENFEIYKL
jgi:hypothetical protein